MTGRSCTPTLAAFAAAVLLAACQETQPVAPAEAGAPEPAVPAGAGAPPATAAHSRLLAGVRAATAQYQRVEVAEAAGYRRASECVVSPLGGMGYHYLNESLLDGVVDPTEPELLVYEPQPNGRLKLVAVEYMVPAAAWDPVHGPDSPPSLGDQPFDDHRPPGSGGPPFPHYQLHAWIWKHNPAGMHTPFNPAVDCRFAE